MAKPDIWMPLYIGDYLADTMHLTTEQHGAYLLLIMAYWKNGGALPSDDRKLMAICRLGADAWSMHKHTLASFFDLDSDPELWIHVRAEKEMEKAGNNQEKRTLRAQKAAEARWSKNAPSNAPGNAPSIPQAMLNECPSPSPSHKALKEPSLRSGKKKSESKKPAFELPPWIGTEAWSSFVEMRKQSKRQLTENAMRLAVKTLEKLEAEGHRADDVLNQSTFHSWQGLFAIKGDYQNGQTNGQRIGAGRLSAVDQVRAENDAAEARRRAQRPAAEVTGHLQESPPLDGDWEREFASIRDVDGKIVGDDGGPLRAQVDLILRDE